MSITLKPMNCKKKNMNIKAPLNVHNFKTKPPFDIWGIPFDRGLQNSFCGKNDESSAGAFQKSADGN